MRRMFGLGVCVVALAALPASEAFARHHSRPTRCAQPQEVTAVAATSIQQELMVAALTCNEIARFNEFQTSFGPELRSSDRALMNMFKRLYGGRGEAEYHAFKTRLANNSEMRSIHGNHEYCETAALVFAAALAPSKPSLADFVAGVRVEDPSPVGSCQMTVQASLTGALAASPIFPRPKPAEFEDVSIIYEMPKPTAGGVPLNGPQAPVAVAVPSQDAQPAKPAPADKKKKGFLGIFD